MRYIVYSSIMLWAMQKATNSIVEALNYNIYYLGAPTISNEYMQWYHPFKCITWFLYYHEANYLFTNAIMWVGFGLFLIFIIVLLLKPKALLTSHGSARWAEYKDLLKMNLISSNGVTIGLYDSPFKRSLTKQLRRLEVKKNEKLAYAEMEFDEKQDKVLDRIPEKITVWLEEYNANTDPKRRKVLGQKIKQAQAYLKNPPKFDIKKYRWTPTYYYDFFYKLLVKLYKKLPHFYLRDNSNKHLAVVAPTRSGKGVGLIIPTLLGSWKSSVIVNDIKSENWGVTAGYRKKMGHVAIKFEPTSDDGSSARWNPLDEIPIGNPMEVSKAQNLAQIIADYEGKGNPDHWTSNATNVIMTVILHLKYAHYTDPENYPTPPTLYSVASFLKSSISVEQDKDGVYKQTAKGFVEAAKGLVMYEHVPPEGIDIVEWNTKTYSYETRHFTQEDLRAIYPQATSLNSMPGTHPIIYQAFVEITSKPDNELGSIVSTANTALKEYLDPLLAYNTSVSDFCIDDLMNYKKPVSLYLVTPPSDLLRLAPIFRLFFEMMVKHHARSIGTYVNGQAKSNYKHNCLFLMDEFSSLGNLQSFAATLSYIAGYGMKVFLINQGLPQINGIYGKDNQILMNCHLKIFYAPNDNDTAQYAETEIGKATIESKSKTRNAGRFIGYTSTSTSQMARSLMTADELKRMEDQEVIIASGSLPVLTDKIKYYENNYYLKKLINAPIVSDVIRTDPVRNANAKREALLSKQASQTSSDTFYYDNNIKK